MQPMNDRQRFIATMHYQPRDRAPICDFGFWNETIPAWHKQGLPEHVVYLVKSEVTSGRDLQSAMEAAIAHADPPVSMAEDADGRPVISRAQGEILRLIAEGYSNQGIAEMRGTSLRSTESLVHRTFAALGLGNDKRMSPRVQAVRMWQQGRVSVR